MKYVNSSSSLIFTNLPATQLLWPTWSPFGLACRIPKWHFPVSLEVCMYGQRAASHVQTVSEILFQDPVKILFFKCPPREQIPYSGLIYLITFLSTSWFVWLLLPTCLCCTVDNKVNHTMVLILSSSLFSHSYNVNFLTQISELE